VSGGYTPDIEPLSSDLNGSLLRPLSFDSLLNPFDPLSAYGTSLQDVMREQERFPHGRPVDVTPIYSSPPPGANYRAAADKWGENVNASNDPILTLVSGFAYVLGHFEASILDIGYIESEPSYIITYADGTRLLEMGSPTTGSLAKQAIDILTLGQLAKHGAVSGALPRKVGVETPSTLTGQIHHPISKPIFKELEQHPNLAGKYTPRDPRFTTQAIDKAAHNGWPRWHRDLDAEVGQWIRQNQGATKDQFETWLRWRYSQPDLKARFPNGF
jgi:hypothetical protein